MWGNTIERARWPMDITERFEKQIGSFFIVSLACTFDSSISMRQFGQEG